MSVALAELGTLLDRFQRDHGLTTIEMFQGLTSWQQLALKYMLRAERNPADPDREADLDYGAGDTEGGEP